MAALLGLQNSFGVNTICLRISTHLLFCTLIISIRSDCEEGHKVADFVDSICDAATAAADGVVPKECEVEDDDSSAADPTISTL